MDEDWLAKKWNAVALAFFTIAVTVAVGTVLFYSAYDPTPVMGVKQAIDTAKDGQTVIVYGVNGHVMAGVGLDDVDEGKPGRVYAGFRRDEARRVERSDLILRGSRLAIKGVFRRRAVFGVPHYEMDDCELATLPWYAGVRW